MKLHRVLLSVGLMFVTFCGAALAQDTASITGTVTDPSGAAVPGAQVTLNNPEHGINRSATTNSSGDYLFASLPIGSYNMTVTAEGFKKYEAKAIVLRVADKARVNVTLPVGTVATEIVVQGSEVAQVQTQSSELGNTVSGKEVTQLELNGRDFTQLVALSPGVTDQSGQDEGEPGATTVAFSINGGRTEYNNFEIDGGEALDNGSNSTLNVYPSIDAIAEVKVLTSDFGAQYGKNGSGTVEVETKSGTNAFHGDLYEFFRNTALNATPEFQTSVPAYHKNDFGFTIGGPVYIPGHYNTNKQKTFFFWSEEWRREVTPASGFFGTTPVPTNAERTGDFSDVCPGASCPVEPALIDGAANPLAGQPFPSNQVPVDSNPVIPALLAMIPAPNVGNNEWFNPPSLPMNWRQELFRIDHNINDKVRANFRYIHDSWVEQYPVPLWTDGTSFPTIQTNFTNPGVSMVARLTANISPTLLNEFVASYTTDHIGTHLTGAWQRGNISSNLGLYSNGFNNEAPGVSVNDGTYSFTEDPGYVPEGPLNSNPTFDFRDNLTKIVGSHNLQMGISVINAHKNEVPQPGTGTNGILNFANSSTVTTGNAFADLLIGNIGSFTQEQNAFKMHEMFNIVEGYLQDDWHATQKLTLNLGIRLSYYGTYREKNNLAWNFDPALYVPGASTVDPVTQLVDGNPYNGWVDCGVTKGVPAGCMSNHPINPAPRIGFAFDPKGDGKWAVRGGYGIFFEHTNGNESNTEALEPYNINTQITSFSNISGYDQLNPGLLTSSGGGVSTSPLQFVSIPNKAVWPYMQQWHFDIQHDLGRSTVATVSYVGSVGTHLTRSYELNQIAPVPANQNPYSFGQVITGDDCGSVSVSDTTGQATGTANVDTGNPVTTTGSWANNLAVACGFNANFYRPYLGVGGIERKDQTGSSNYNALEMSLRHNIGGLELNAAYTYSHSIDDSSDNGDFGFVNSYNLNAYRASSNFDQRHNISIAYVYDVPVFKGHGLAHSLLGGWQWSGITLIQSGTPFSVYNKSSTPDNAGVGNTFATAASYPDLVGDPRSGTGSSPLAGNFKGEGFGPLLYNPAAFQEPTGLTFGTSTRNIINNPWRTNFNMALLKHFAITENKYFEFRAEAFNVFNHLEYSWLGGDGGSAANNSGSGTLANEITCYGGATNNAGDPGCASTIDNVNPLLRPAATHLPRILQLGLKFVF